MQRGVNVIVTFDFSARSYVVRTQGLDSEVTGESEASMQNEGLATPKSALAKGRCTAAPPKRPQNSAQTVSSTDFTINRTLMAASLLLLVSFRQPHRNNMSEKLFRQRQAVNSRYPQ
ncbi:hypothetical protein ALC60_02728 [Trachymyrmex zeteki]|uniref:Uncharacterized protein n=1 Tax=Mycetomoellerius zeteki TaxID=64791 RepID=A0A151XDG3_9HYME|nr:hypothetical protein ALC60_02728 [Trachymyrmex zeteki]